MLVVVSRRLILMAKKKIKKKKENKKSIKKTLENLISKGKEKGFLTYDEMEDEDERQHA